MYAMMRVYRIGCCIYFPLRQCTCMLKLSYYYYYILFIIFLVACWNRWTRRNGSSSEGAVLISVPVAELVQISID